MRATAPLTELPPVQGVPILSGQEKVKNKPTQKDRAQEKGLIQTLNMQMLAGAPGPATLISLVYLSAIAKHST